MRMTFDAEADAAYVYLVPEIAPGGVSQTRQCMIPLPGSDISLDFDADGKLLGIEILGARRILRSDTVESASEG